MPRIGLTWGTCLTDRTGRTARTDLIGFIVRIGRIGPPDALAENRAGWFERS